MGYFHLLEIADLQAPKAPRRVVSVFLLSTLGRFYTRAAELTSEAGP